MTNIIMMSNKKNKKKEREPRIREKMKIYENLDDEIKAKVIEIDKHLEKEDVKKYMYERFLVVRMKLLGEPLYHASHLLGHSRKFGEQWWKRYKESGIKGLYTDFSKVGRPSFLSDENKVKLEKHIAEDDKHYSIMDARFYISNKFKVNYSYRGAHNLLRNTFNMNYSKPFLIYESTPENALDIFKDTMVGVDLINRRLFVCDEVSCQNKNTNGRSLHPALTKNIFIQSDRTFNVSFVGFQPINGGVAYIQPLAPSTAVNFTTSVAYLIMKNTNNLELIKHLFSAVTNPNLRDDVIKKDLLAKKVKKEKKIINDINNKLYDDKDKLTERVKKVKNYANKLINVSTYQVRLEKEYRLIKNLLDEGVDKLASDEIPIDLVLDGASIHTASVSVKAMEIMNVTTRFLPVRSPFLNPIEDVWRTMKHKLSNIKINTEIELMNLFTIEFYEEIYDESYYKNWVKELGI